MKKKQGKAMVCLNPCFNGRYSQRKAKEVKETVGESLNPCFNGRYSQSKISLSKLKRGKS